MEVLILSKTGPGVNGAFVGGMVLETKQNIRLLSRVPQEDYQIGDVWDLDFTTVEGRKDPHNEDVLVISGSFVRSIDNIRQFIIASGVRIWRGPIDQLYGGRLLWAEAGAGYVSELQHSVPIHSEGFWINDKPLNYEPDGHYLYLSVHSHGKKHKLKYKGLADPPRTIKPHTLLRVSLAGWWKPEGSIDEKRCYLLLAGWY